MNEVGLKILMVAPTPFFADRGCHVRILGEVRALAELGHQVKLVTYPLGRDVPGVETYRTISVPWYRKLSAGPSYHKYYIDVFLALRTARLIRSFRPDVIHAHLHEGAAVAHLATRLAWSAGTPMLLDYQGSLADEVVAHGFTGDDKLQHRVLRRVEDFVQRAADHIITSTTQSADALVQKWGYPSTKVTAVPDGADTREFRPASEALRQETRRKNNLPLDRPLAIYVGVLSEYQGIDLLLQAAARLKARGDQTYYLLVGYPNAEGYRRQAADLGIGDDVTFTGRVPYEETRSLTAAADFALAPKLSVSEGNLKLFNYMACGLPIVCFDNPVNREILNDACVYAASVDADSLADAIATLASDADRRRVLGELGRTRVEQHFSWLAAAKRIDGIYRAHLQSRVSA